MPSRLSPRSAIVPPFTGVFSLSFLKFTMEAREENVLKLIPPKKIQEYKNTRKHRRQRQAEDEKSGWGRTGDRGRRSSGGGGLTVLGQDHLLHVGHRSGVLHVFGQILLWHLLLRPVPASAQNTLEVAPEAKEGISEAMLL